MSDLPQQDTINQYVADGMEDVYTYAFLIPTEEDISVYVTPAGQQANDESDIETLNVEYTVQQAGDVDGGTITFESAFIPGAGATVTLSRSVQASINTNYTEAQTITGPNLDNSFQREMLVIQQNQSKIDDVSLRYQFSSFLPDTANRNVVPTLDPGYVWIGAAAGGVAAAFLDEDPDCSTLRSELASETQGADGAGLVGYYDESRSLGTTVRDQLNEYGSQVQGSDGASLIGYYDEINLSPTTVAEALNDLESTLLPSGMITYMSTPSVPDGWAQCNGGSFDMVGSLTSNEIQRLGNLYNTSGQLSIYGVGLDSYYTTKPGAGIVYHQCAATGAAGAPNPHTSGFVMVVTQTGAPGIPQIVQLTTTPGNTIVPGSYYELKAPSGRSTAFWFRVDGAGTPPSFPGGLVAMVSISSTDTAEQVAQAIVNNSYMQYRVPLISGHFIRAWDDGAGFDPDAATRTNIDGTIIGDLVGSTQDDTLQDHQHTAHQPGANFQPEGSGGINQMQISGGSLIFSSPVTGQVDQTGLDTGPVAQASTETRPINIYMMPIVKF